MARMERRFGAWAARAAGLATLAFTAAACSTYPSEPRYPTTAQPPAPIQRPSYPPQQPAYEPPPAPDAVAPPRPMPVDPIEAGALPPAGGWTPPPATPPGTTQPGTTPPPTGPGWQPSEPATMTPGAAYLIQAGDTLSGIARRFQTPVQILINLNGLGPRGSLTQGQSLILPDSAMDLGPDPYATGPSPRGVRVPDGAAPPPPPPPSGNPAAPPPMTAQPSQVQFQWPVRGEIVRRFGPVSTGERNNGINIAASAGATVVAAAGGRVAYVGDDLVGQGLVVLLIHADGWRTVYGHLGSATVSDGDEVRAGQQIGTVGLTAGDGRPSMHFETRRMQGDNPAPIDPLSVLPR